MSETDNQFRALIDRILRCREAEDEAKQDTKEIYAEAKSSGYDKTAMGALVRELRSKDKNPAKFEEKSAVLDLYRDAYERASHVHARDGQKKSKNAPRPSTNDEPSPEVGPQAEASLVGTDTGTPADREGRFEGEAAPADLPTFPPSSASAPPGAATKAPDAIPLPVSGAAKFRLRPNCQHPELCRSGTRDHCHSCTVASATLQHGALA